MKTLFAIAIMAISTGFVFAEEIVINQRGQSVLLKDDNTWELIDVSGDDGKVIFTIHNAVDYVYWNEQKDDMDEFDYWNVWAGCKYYFTVKNNTEFKVRVQSFKVKTTDRNRFDGSDDLIIWGVVLKPGYSYKGGDGFAKFGKIRDYMDDYKPKEIPSKEKQKELIDKYGCKAQASTIFLAKSMMDKFVVFSKDAKIAGQAIPNFVKGSLNGMYPLKEKIEF